MVVATVKIYLQACYWKRVISILSCQAIISINVDIIHWCINTSLGLNGLNNDGWYDELIHKDTITAMKAVNVRYIFEHAIEKNYLKLNLPYYAPCLCVTSKQW